MFVQSKQSAVATSDAASLSFVGQELNETAWKLAQMNLALHGIEANLGDRAADTFHDDLHSRLSDAEAFALFNRPARCFDPNAPLVR
jgi:type I restriction enzyme M protein